MPRRIIPPCLSCRHFHDQVADDRLLCDAFPEEGIPEIILSGLYNHEKPCHDGVGFEARAGEDGVLLDRGAA